MVFAGGSNAAKQAYDWAEQELADFVEIAAERSKDAERQSGTSKSAPVKKAVGVDEPSRTR